MSTAEVGRQHAGNQGASGQALVEFALIAPIFFLLVFAIIQLGLLFGGQNGLVNGVRDTARYASTYRVVEPNDSAAACGLALDHLTNVLHNEMVGFDPVGTNYNPTITYSWHLQPDGLWYEQVLVKVDYKFPLYVPLVSAFLDGMDGTVDQKLQLSAQEEMRIENDPLATGYSDVPCA
jgi:Flp pilus assembly protein TadG